MDVRLRPGIQQQDVRQVGQPRPVRNQVGVDPGVQRPGLQQRQQAWGAGLQDVRAPQGVAGRKKLESTDAMLRRIDVQLAALDGQHGVRTSPERIKANAEGGVKSFFKALGKMITSIPAKVVTAVITVAKGVFNIGQLVRLATYPIGRCFAGAQGADRAVKEFFSSGNDKMNKANEAVRNFFGGGGSAKVNESTRDASNDAFGGSAGMISDSFGMGFHADALGRTQLGEAGDVKNSVLSQAGVDPKPGDISMQIGMPLMALQVTDGAEALMGGLEKRADGQARVREGEQLFAESFDPANRRIRADLQVGAQFMDQSGHSLTEDGNIEIARGTVNMVRGGNGIVNLLATSNTLGPQVYGVQTLADSMALWTQVGGAGAGALVATVDTVVDSVQAHRVGKRIDRANEHLDNPTSLTQVSESLRVNEQSMWENRDRLAALRQEFDAASGQLERGDRELAGMDRDIGRRQTDRTQALSDLRDARTLRDEASDQLDGAQQELDRREVDLQAGRDHLTQLGRSAERCRTDIAEVTQDIRSLRSEIAGLKNPPEGQAVNTERLARRERRLEQLTNHREDLRGRLTDLGERVTQARQEVETLSQRVGRQAGRVERLEAQLDQRQEVVNGLKTEITRMDRRLEGLRAGREELAGNLDRLEVRKDGLGRDVQRIGNRLARLEQRVELLSARQGELKEVEGAVELYKKNLTQTRKHKIMSAIKNAVLAAAGVTMIVAATAALAATPVGWALAGAALVGAVGFGLYKAYKAQRREVNIDGLKQRESMVNRAVRDFQLSHGMRSLTETARLTPDQRDTLKDLLQVRSEIQGALARTSPDRASRALIDGLRSPDADVRTRSADALRNVFKINPDVFSDALRRHNPNVGQVARETLASKLSLFQASA